MTRHPLAGTPAPKDILIDVGRLQREFLERTPDPGDPRQRVSFGTSGHRGTPLDGSLTAAHIAAITQAICDFRRSQGIDGPLYMGKDTHALSTLAQSAALEVLAANERRHDHPARRRLHADAGDLARDPGTQSRPRRSAGRRHRHHPVAQPAGGRRLQVQPAQRRPGRHRRHAMDRTARERAARVEQRRGEARLDAPRRSTRRRRSSDDLVVPYVDDLGNVIDMEAIRSAGVTIGVDPLGGASLPYWQSIAAHYRLNLTVVNQRSTRRSAS